MQNTIQQLTSLSKSTIVLTGYKIFFLLSATQLLLEDSIPYNVIDWNNYALPKLLVIFTVTIFLEEMIKGFLRVWDKRPHIVVEDGSTSSEIDAQLDNVPLEDLITFLLETEGRAVIPAKEKFGITTSEHKKLGDNLERVGILKRGENNARILSDMDPEMMIDILCRAEDSDQLNPILVRQGNSSQYVTSDHSSVTTAPSLA